MKKHLTCLALMAIVLMGVPFLTGCGGSSDNSVALPPENPPTEEELQAQSDGYAAQEQEMRLRDRRM